MAILDKFLQFDPAATLMTVTAPSTNVIDSQQARDMGIGPEGIGQLEAQITITTAFVAAGAATLQISFQMSVDNATWVDGLMSGILPKANLGAGTVIRIKMPEQASNPSIAGIPRYYRLNYTVATGPFTGGAFEADLAMNPQASLPPAYISGFTVAN